MSLISDERARKSVLAPVVPPPVVAPTNPYHPDPAGTNRSATANIVTDNATANALGLQNMQNSRPQTREEHDTHLAEVMAQDAALQAAITPKSTPHTAAVIAYQQSIIDSGRTTPAQKAAARKAIAKLSQPRTVSTAAPNNAPNLLGDSVAAHAALAGGGNNGTSVVGDVRDTTSGEAVAEVANAAVAESNKPTGAAPTYTPEHAIQDMQMALANQIYLRATGQVPSAAELMLNKANQQSMRQQLAQAASVRGGANQAMVARTAQNNIAQSSVENAQNAAILKSQEQQQAEGSLAQVLGSTRGQNAQEGQFNAGMQLEFDKFVSGRKIELMKVGLDANKALLQAQQEAADRGLRSSQFDQTFGQRKTEFTQTMDFDQAKFEEQKLESKRNYDFAVKQAAQAQSNADRAFWKGVADSILATVSAGGAAALSGGAV